MPRNTDIDKIRDVALSMLNMKVTCHEKYPFILTHPIFENVVVCVGKEMLDINNEDDLKRVREIYSKTIKTADFPRIMTVIRVPYQLTFLKFVKPYLKKKEFDEWLAHCWVASENPNQDANVSLRTFISWFRQANKKTIMTDEDYEYYCKLPDEVAIYRGVAVGRAEQEGLSWTCNRDTAEWFAHRYDYNDNYGYLLKAKIKKNDILAYFNTRDEDEVVCDSSKIYDVERER